MLSERVDFYLTVLFVVMLIGFSIDTLILLEDHVRPVIVGEPGVYRRNGLGEERQGNLDQKLSQLKYYGSKNQKGIKIHEPQKVH